MLTERQRLIVATTAGFMMTLSAAVAILLKKSRKKRRFAVRPMNRRRQQEGIFGSLFQDMQNLEWDRQQYFKYTRMTPEFFADLVERLTPSLQKDPSRKNALSPKHRLLITIHYLAEGCSMQEIARNYRVGRTTAHKVIKETCGALWDVLQPLVLPTPTKGLWVSAAEEFYEKYNIPNCIGAVAGKYIHIQPPSKSGSVYNYKKSYGVVLLATCDSNYRFTLVDFGAAGSNHNATYFQECGFGEALLNGRLEIPFPKALPNSNIILPHFFVADAAFPLHTNIMRPYPGTRVDITKNIFNDRLSRARRTITNTFGVVCHRWRILRKPMIVSVEMCEKIVKAIVVLHNFLQRSEHALSVADRKYCPAGFTDSIGEDGEINMGSWREDLFRLESVARLGGNNYSRSLKENRDALATYLEASHGSVYRHET